MLRVVLDMGDSRVVAQSDIGRLGETRQPGAGEGNRTLVVSLGSFCSTIELHPRSRIDSTADCARKGMLGLTMDGLRNDRERVRNLDIGPGSHSVNWTVQSIQAVFRPCAVMR